MNNYTSNISRVLPNKKINLFIVFLLLLGVISGSIFMTVLSKNDKSMVIEKTSSFMKSISDNNISNMDALLSSIKKNMIFFVLMVISSSSIILIVVNTFLVYLKGFIVGFTLSSFILSYKYKGILASFIYLVPTYIFDIIATVILSIYSIMISYYLFNVIFNKNTTRKNYLFKRYLIIIGISLALFLLNSLCEAFLVPSLFKLFIKIFI